MKKLRDINEFGVIGPWLPDYVCDFSDGQVEGIRRMGELILTWNQGQTSTPYRDWVHALSVACGIGKSTLIAGLIAYCMTAVPVRPLLVITDRKKRFEGYADREYLKRKVGRTVFEHGHVQCVSRLAKEGIG